MHQIAFDNYNAVAIAFQLWRGAGIGVVENRDDYAQVNPLRKKSLSSPPPLVKGILNKNTENESEKALKPRRKRV